MNKESQLKTKYKAILNVGGKLNNYRKSYSTPQRLLKALKDEGINMGNVIRIETFQVWVCFESGLIKDASGPMVVR